MVHPFQYILKPYVWIYFMQPKGVILRCRRIPPAAKGSGAETLRGRKLLVLAEAYWRILSSLKY